MTITSTLEFAKKFPTEFAALPEPYQNDDVLVYHIDSGKLTCEPKKSQLQILGMWNATYQDNQWKVTYPSLF